MSISARRLRIGYPLTRWLRKEQFPKLLGAHTTDGSSSASPQNVNIGSPGAGQLVVICIRLTAATTITTPGGWTLIATTQENDRTGVYYRLCDGSEGATVSFTFGVATRFAAVALRFSGAGIPLLAQFTRQRTTGTTQPQDPMSEYWGKRDYCYVCFLTYEGGSIFSTRPSGYSSLSTESGTITNTGSSGAGLSTVHWTMKFSRSTRDAAGNWTTTGNAVWSTIGVQIPPG
jgi:hypothetical protein